MFHIFFFNWGFPGGSDGKESVCNIGDLGSIPGSGRSPGEGNGYPLQCSCLENSMHRGAWRTTVHGVTESDATEWLTFSLSHFLIIPMTREHLSLQWKGEAKLLTIDSIVLDNYLTISSHLSTGKSFLSENWCLKQSWSTKTVHISIPKQNQEFH